jgi:transposase
MEVYCKFVGLDVHKATIAAAVAEGAGGVPCYLGEIPNTPEAVAQLVRKLKKDHAPLRFCYEAGPCGFGLYRQLRSLGQECQVVAPSLIPKKPGCRIKNDRRDSLSLADLFRSCHLTAVWVPGEPQEALRDLTRAREDLMRVHKQAKQRLLGFLLRHGKRYPEKSHWTQAHFRWLETIKFDRPVQQIVFQEYVDLVLAMGVRVKALDTQILAAEPQAEFAPTITALMALRGIDRLAATIVAAEIGELRRFPKAPNLWSFVGLNPSEHSSGPHHVRGAITKAGNGHVRRILLEAAWTYRFPARKTRIIQRRAEQAPQAVQDIAWAAQKRLCARYRALTKRGMLPVKIATALARELTGFIWAIGQTLPPLAPKV